MERRETNRKYYYSRLEQERKRSRDKYNSKVGTPLGAANNLLRGAKQRAAKKGLPFDLDLAWVSDRVDGGLCEITGIAFELCGGRSPFGPTIDRLIPSAGYTKDNCQVVIWAYNAAKGCGTHEDVLKLASALSMTKQD